MDERMDGLLVKSGVFCSVYVECIVSWRKVRAWLPRYVENLVVAGETWGLVKEAGDSEAVTQPKQTALARQRAHF